MIKLTKRAEYALIALVHLADDQAGRGAVRRAVVDGDRSRGHATEGAEREVGYVSAREMAELYPVPRRLLAEVLKDLCRHHLLESHRGASGGYALARPPEAISLGEVIAALEGPPADVPATPGLCPIKNPMQRVRLGVWDLMQRTSLRDLMRAGRPSTRAAAALAGALPPARVAHRPAALAAQAAASLPHLS